MPKISMPSCSVGALPWTESLNIAIENNFDAFEISTYYPSVDLDHLDSKDIKEARSKAEKAGIEICVHAPFFELNIGAFAKGIRDESVNYIKKSIGLCADIGGNILILHSGNYTYTYPGGVTRHTNDRLKIQWENNIESLKRINDFAALRGVTICLENMIDRSIDQSFLDLIEIRNEVSESLKFTFDIGHARLKEKNGVENGLKLLGDNIRHIHFTDNNGVNDDHCAIGHGNYDYSGVMKFVKNFPGIVTLEVIYIGVDPSVILKSLKYFKILLNKEKMV